MATNCTQRNILKNNAMMMLHEKEHGYSIKKTLCEDYRETLRIGMTTEIPHALPAQVLFQAQLQPQPFSIKKGQVCLSIDIACFFFRRIP